ncbi:hypothetical protein ACFLZH_05960, partial [Patescibacteria group bacterium]
IPFIMQMQESIPQKTFIPPSRDQLIGTQLSNGRAQNMSDRVTRLTGVEVGADQIIELGIRACSNELNLGRIGADNILEALGMEPEMIESVDDTAEFHMDKVGEPTTTPTVVGVQKLVALKSKRIAKGPKYRQDRNIKGKDAGKKRAMKRRRKRQQCSEKQERYDRERARDVKARERRIVDYESELSLTDEYESAREESYQPMPLPKQPKKPSEVRGLAKGLLISLCKARQKNLHRQSPERLVSLAEQYERVTGREVNPIELFTADLQVLADEVLRAA